MGKREIGTLGVVDLIVSMMVSEIVAISIEDINGSVLIAVLPILSLVILEIILDKLSLKSRKFKNFFEGKPTIIIDNGHINYKEMVKQRYTIDDLLFELRQNGYKTLENIDYAILEANGKLSIFPKKYLDKAYPMPLIVDGVIDKRTLKSIHKTNIWLDYILSKNHLHLEDVFYAFYKNNKLYIINKNNISYFE